MDTSELLQRGARSKIVDLCKEIEEVVLAVPGLKAFAIGMIRETLGLARIGRKASLNGDGRERLADQLIEARQRRLHERAVKGGAGNSRARTPQERAELKRRMVKQWALGRSLGYTGNTTPSNATIAKLQAKANAKAKLTPPEPKG